jgi:hypothetical protein
MHTLIPTVNLKRWSLRVTMASQRERRSGDGLAIAKCYSSKRLPPPSATSTSYSPSPWSLATTRLTPCTGRRAPSLLRLAPHPARPPPLPLQRLPSPRPLLTQRARSLPSIPAPAPLPLTELILLSLRCYRALLFLLPWRRGASFFHHLYPRAACSCRGRRVSSGWKKILYDPSPI